MGVEDTGRQAGMLSEGWVMTWVGALQQTELTEGFMEGEVQQQCSELQLKESHGLRNLMTGTS